MSPPVPHALRAAIDGQPSCNKLQQAAGIGAAHGRACEARHSALNSLTILDCTASRDGGYLASPGRSARLLRIDEQRDPIRQVVASIRGSQAPATESAWFRETPTAAPGDVQVVTSSPGGAGDEGQLKLSDELITRARQTAARVRFIEDASLLADVGGVGALLRFRI